TLPLPPCGSGQMEQLLQGSLVQLGTDHAQAAGNIRSAAAHVGFAGHMVKVDPAIRAGQDALGAQHHAVLAAVQLFQRVADLLLGVHPGSLAAPAGEHLVGVMVVMMVVVMAAAAAALAVMIVMMMLMVM